jgi:hypothetical protein
MVEEKTTPTRRVRDVVQAEFSKFWKDPLIYAIERWVACFFFVIAVSILASAVKMLIGLGVSMVS